MTPEQLHTFLTFWSSLPDPGALHWLPGAVPYVCRHISYNGQQAWSRELSDADIPELRACAEACAAVPDFTVALFLARRGGAMPRGMVGWHTRYGDDARTAALYAAVVELPVVDQVVVNPVALPMDGGSFLVQNDRGEPEWLVRDGQFTRLGKQDVKKPGVIFWSQT